jgi:hypothetical protein
MAVMEMEEIVMETSAEGPREKLRQILEKNGDAILQDQDRVEGLLRDHCGPFRKEISALVGALNERVPQELKGSWQTAMTPEAMRARLVQRLEDHRGLAPEVSEWAVDTWSYALGIGLGRRSDRLDSVVMGGGQFNQQGTGAAGVAAGAAVGFGAGVATEHERDAARQRAIASDRPGGAAAAAVAGAGLLATVEQKKKAGMGVAAVALLAVVGAYALHHKPAPDPTPTPVVIIPPTPAPTPKPTPAEPVLSAIAAGTPISIRLNQGIQSDTTTIGQTYTATLAVPLQLNGKTLLPVGADATIKVISVQEGGKVTGQSSMQLELLDLASGGKTYKVSTGPIAILGVKQAAQATKQGVIGVTVGALGGFLVGKGLHHPKAGAGVGAVAGGGAGVALTKPQPAKAYPEQLIRFRLTKALTVGA